MLGFFDCVKSSWEKPSRKAYSSAVLADKVKTLRYDLKHWKVNISEIKLLIQNCNKVIVLLDTLEEERPLFRTEFNFHQIVKRHLDDLLRAKCSYWKKRCTVRWIKQGEDNTKFFHAMATERYRRNNIAMLKDSQGNEVSDHDQTAVML
jgi:mannosylglycoprotein endo-beta-mannosidase